MFFLIYNDTSRPVGLCCLQKKLGFRGSNFSRFFEHSGIVFFLIPGIYPGASSKEGAPGSQRDNRRYRCAGPAGCVLSCKNYSYSLFGSFQSLAQSIFRPKIYVGGSASTLVMPLTNAHKTWTRSIATGSRSAPNFLRFQWIRFGRQPRHLLSRFSQQRSRRLSSCLSCLTTQLPWKSQSPPRCHGNEQLFHDFHLGRLQAPVLSHSRQPPRRMATWCSSSRISTNDNSHALPLPHPIWQLSQAVRPSLLPMERAKSLSRRGRTTHIRGQLTSPTMKHWVSEDNLICQTQTREERPVTGFWELLYPRHPHVRLRLIIDAHEEDQVFCLECG